MRAVVLSLIPVAWAAQLRFPEDAVTLWHGFGEPVPAGDTPSHAMEAYCPEMVATTQSLSKSDYLKITAGIHKLMDDLPEDCKDYYCPRASFAGCVVRMAGHDFMDYVGGNDGGSDGCTDYNDPDNKGLIYCFVEGFGDDPPPGAVLMEWCDKVSLADFIVIAAEAVMVKTREWHILAHEEDSSGAYRDSLPIDFSEDFMYGRATKGADCMYREHLLPNPDHGCADVERNFVGLMSLTHKEAALISSVHTLGKAHAYRSGFSGWWSDPLNSRRFNNNYYCSMAMKGWMGETVTVAGNSRIQWGLSDVVNPSGAHQMMLTSDVCLLYGVGDKSEESDEGPWHPLVPEDTCCAWIEKNVPMAFSEHFGTNRNIFGRYADNKICGVDRKSVKMGQPLREACCHGVGKPEHHDCGDPREPHGMAHEAVLDFCNDDNYWMESFHKLWRKIVRLGHTDLKPLEEDE